MQTSLLCSRAPLLAPFASQQRPGSVSRGAGASSSSGTALAAPPCLRRQWLLRRPLRAARPALTRRSTAFCTSSNEGLPGQQHVQQQQQQHEQQHEQQQPLPVPPPAPRRGLLAVAPAAAWLVAASAVLLAARPAAAAAAAAPGAAAGVPPPPPVAAAAPEAAASYQAAAAAQQQQQRGWSDTGILLAVRQEEERISADVKPVPGSKVTLVSPEELREQGNAAVRRLIEEHTDQSLLKTYDRSLRPSKGGRKVRDPTSSVVPDAASWPTAKDFEKHQNYGVVTAWRPEKLREMTYTQFWNLVRERKVDTVKYSDDRRSVWVTTKATAPGGARTDKVALPFDPELFDHLVEHGVYIQEPKLNPVMPVLHALARLVFPIAFSFLLIKFAFRLGRKQKRDKIFGGAKMEMISAKDATVTFKDIAGIDQVKAEIMEIVAFLRNPQKFLALGARSPAGVLLVGPPGTGKTLLAKAIAGEAGVPFFSIAGTEFMEMFVGVGASRVRDMFQQARKNAPCILFIDEFDGIGKARSYGGGGNDESVHTINQLLTEMDGFEDNTGIVVMAATNRPSALDQALTRPGRFDRIVHLPLPNVEGRVGILKVHARDKKVDPNLDFAKIARATAGFTGAELMNLMNQSAIVAVRQQQPFISEAEVFEALEKIHRDKLGRGGTAAVNYESDIVPPTMRKTIAVYEAARALVGYITPRFDEIQRVSVCPGGVATGYTYFLPLEETLESRIITKGYMEAKMVVAMAGRCAERLVLGEGNVSTAGAADLEHANNIAREMVFRCGFSKRLGPVSLMDNEETYLGNRGHAIADLSTELAMIAYEEIEEVGPDPLPASCGACSLLLSALDAAHANSTRGRVAEACPAGGHRSVDSTAGTAAALRSVLPCCDACPALARAQRSADTTHPGSRCWTPADRPSPYPVCPAPPGPQLVEAAEAKAYYGLASNYKALAALANTLMERESLTGEELRELLESQGVKKFEGPETEGFGWTQDGGLSWPGKPAETSADVAEQLSEYLAAKAEREGAGVGGNGANGAAAGGNGAPPAWWATNSPYTVRTDIAQLLDESR
ncbi:hypothetical protein ABPG75_008435 [Micractinium tetrahymenae]